MVINKHDDTRWIIEERYSISTCKQIITIVITIVTIKHHHHNHPPSSIQHYISVICLNKRLNTCIPQSIVLQLLYKSYSLLDCKIYYTMSKSKSSHGNIFWTKTNIVIAIVIETNQLLKDILKPGSRSNQLVYENTFLKWMRPSNIGPLRTFADWF